MRTNVFRVLLALVVCLLAATMVASAAVPISVVKVDTPSDGKAGTFQSHNQKVVANANGIFMTYMHTRNTASGNTWHLARSTDGGATFSTVYESTDLTGPPAMETDENNNIYLTFPTYGVSTHFLGFTEANGYTAPAIDKTYNGASSAGKYAMAYDQQRQQFYIATQWGALLTVDKQGNFTRNLQLFSGSQGNSGTAYPHLFVETAGTTSVLHYAVTTADHDDHIPYESIRYVKSTDGGLNWQAMGGTSITTPTTPEPNGPSTMINLPDEITHWSTWLSTMHAKGGKVHFAYHTRDPWDPDYFGNPGHIDRQHYMRFNGTTGVREIDSWEQGGTWTGSNITISTTDGLLASDLNDSSSPLYMVGASPGGHLSALMSLDNGSTWVDYATIPLSWGLYAIGGCRGVTVDGKVIGSFSGRSYSEGPWDTYFYQFPVYFPGGVWTSTPSGNWSTPGNWQDNTVADGTDMTATFRGSTGVTVTLDTPRTIGNLRFDNADYAIAGANALTLAKSTGVSTITVGNTGGTRTATISATLSGTNGLTKLGAGTLILSGANSYTGGTTVGAGTLTLGHASNTLADTDTVTVSGGTLDVANPDTVGAVTLSSGTIGGAATLTGSSYSLTNTGTASAALAGGGTLAKTGAGTATLSGANTYSGGTTVSGGKLLVNNTSGSGTGTGTVTVDTDGTLGGTGTIGGAVTIASGGTLAPGVSPGTLTVTNATETWAGGGKYAWQLLDATGTPGAGWDLAAVTGTGHLNVTATSDNKFTLVLETLSSSAPDVQGMPLNWNFSEAHSWKIASSAEAITGWDVADGQASSLFTIDATSFAGGVSPAAFTVSKTGDDLYLNQAAITSLTWNLAGGGDWNTTDANWIGGRTTFVDDGGDDVIFNNTAGGTITISPNMSPNSTTVSADSGTYTFTGGPIDSGSLTKSGGGGLFLLGNNTYSGTTTYSGGNLYVGNNTTAGSLGTGEVILENGVTLRFRRNDAITVNNLISGSGRVYQNFGSVVTLANDANSFDGAVHAQNGTMIIASIADVGTPSALGAGNIIYLGNSQNSAGTLKYTGAGHDSNRRLYLWGWENAGGGAVDASGTGPLNLTSTAAIGMNGDTEYGASDRLLTLTGSNTGANTLAAIIPDLDTDGSLYGHGPAITALTKSGAGTWILSGANTYSDVTDITAGVLNIRHDHALGSHGNGYADMTHVRSGAALQLQGGISVGATGANGETTFLWGTGVDNDGAIRNISGDNTYNGWINLKNAATRINSDSGTLYLPGNNNSPISGNMGATSLSLTFGGAGNINVAAHIHAYGDGILTLIKDGAGTLTLSGAHSYTGGTTVDAGTLLVNNTTGSGTGTGMVTVESGAAIGGTGAIGGDLTLDAGGWLLFSTNDTLSVSGSVSLASSFGVDDLLGLDSSVGVGTYTLIDRTATDFSTLGIQNWGAEYAYDLGGGKSAYFHSGSLQLTVVPEPAPLALLGLGVMGMMIRQGSKRGRS